MIRVNLLKNKVQDPALGAEAIEASGGSSDLRASVIKVIMMFIFVAGLMVYENQSISQLNLEQSRVQNEMNLLQQDASAKAIEVEGVKDVEKQAKELEDKLKLLKLFSKLRLREVKTMDFMQNAIPEKVWLKGLVYEAEKGDMVKGHFQFNGNSVTSDDLTEFVKRLDESPYLGDVIVVKNAELEANKAGSLRDFQFTAQVEGEK